MVKYLIVMFLGLFFANSNIIWADNERRHPQFSDLVYEFHIAELNKTTPLDLTYNRYVRHYIDIFTLQRRSQVEQFMGRAPRYFPIFEDYLQQYDLPLELKYLAVIESGLDPLARSSSNAIGLWQFLFGTAQMFDLKITSYIDERSDVYKSTEAAVRYLKYLYNIFGCWNLALAAYNGGPGELEKAIVRSGGQRDYWKLYPYITESMRNFVPAFIAIIYVFNNADKHMLAAEPPDPLFYDLDTLHIMQHLNFANIGREIGMDENSIRRLNPAYLRNEIPFMGQPMPLVLPRGKTIEFLKSKNQIIATPVTTHNVLPELRPGMVAVQYTVQPGDFLHKIALRFGCTIDDISRWNNLTDRNLAAGTRLVIWTRE